MEHNTNHRFRARLNTCDGHEQVMWRVCVSKNRVTIDSHCLEGPCWSHHMECSIGAKNRDPIYAYEIYPVAQISVWCCTLDPERRRLIDHFVQTIRKPHDDVAQKKNIRQHGGQLPHNLQYDISPARKGQYECADFHMPESRCTQCKCHRIWC